MRSALRPLAVGSPLPKPFFFMHNFLSFSFLLQLRLAPPPVVRASVLSDFLFLLFFLHHPRIHLPTSKKAKKGKQRAKSGGNRRASVSSLYFLFCKSQDPRTHFNHSGTAPKTVRHFSFFSLSVPFFLLSLSLLWSSVLSSPRFRQPKKQLGTSTRRQFLSFYFLFCQTQNGLRLKSIPSPASASSCYPSAVLPTPTGRRRPPRPQGPSRKCNN